MRIVKVRAVLLLTFLLTALVAFPGCAQGEDVPSQTSSSPSSSSSEHPASSAASRVESEPESSQLPQSSEPPSSSSVASSSVAPGPGGLPESPRVQDSYFDDAVFIGDSVSLRLKYYVMNQRKQDPGFMGGAQFLTSGSLGSANALWNVSDESVHPSYQGKKMLIEDAVSLCGAKKIYIMLGINDIALYGIDGSIENMLTLIGRIREKSPNTVFYIQSATPILKGKEGRQLNNANLVLYDQALETMCEEHGFYFVDVASIMRDENGFLPAAYCSDPDVQGIHFTEEACKVWIEYLYTHTA